MKQKKDLRRILTFVRPETLAAIETFKIKRSLTTKGQALDALIELMKKECGENLKIIS